MFYDRLVKSLTDANIQFELLCINDGSKDDTLSMLLQLSQKDKRVKIINFSRNFGHQLAVSAGFDYASGDCVIVIDSDLQDPPEVIPALYAKWLEGYEVVNALRKTRQDTFFKKITAGFFYKGLNMLLTNKIPENVGDFRLLDRRPIEIMKLMRERDRYIRGMTNWIGFDQTFVEFDRDKRFAGKTHYSMRKMFSLATNALFSFSSVPMKLAHFAFAMFFLLAVVVTLYALFVRFTGLDVPGWTSQVLITVVFGAIQMFVLAILSEYIGRIYQQGQDRPLYVVSETFNIDKDPQK